MEKLNVDSNIKSEEVIKCKGVTDSGQYCPLRNECKRFVSEDSSPKIYFLSSPYDVDNQRCESLIEKDID
jgi:hypothetical protein